MDVDLEAEPGKEFLVKWRGLQYDSCTWESAADLAKWGAEAEVARFQSLEPISASAEARKVYPKPCTMNHVP